MRPPRAPRLTNDYLKGYLLANIDEEKRIGANARWRERIAELNAAGKEVEADCFKAWFRSQYASKIRERKRGAKPEEFDRIGTEFHRWLRDASTTVGLTSDDADFLYKCTEYYQPGDEIGVLWNDPAIGIPWPVSNPLLSAKDEALPTLAVLAEQWKAEKW